MKDARLPLKFRACGPCVATWVATRWAFPGVAVGIVVAVVAGVVTGSGLAIGASYLGVFMGLAIVGYCRSGSIVVGATTVNLKGMGEDREIRRSLIRSISHRSESSVRGTVLVTVFELTDGNAVATKLVSKHPTSLPVLGDRRARHTLEALIAALRTSSGS